MQNNIQIKIHPKLYEFFLNFKYEDPSFEKTILVSVLNIQKSKDLQYDLNDGLYRTMYFHEYFYTINKLFLSFNSFLLKKYIENNENNDSKDENWERIFEFASKKNNISYLLIFLLQSKLKIENPSDFSLAKQLISKFYIYENLFRNQVSHGWLDIFYDLDNLNLEIKVDTNPLVLGQKLNPDLFFSSKNPIDNLNNIRTGLKKNMTKDFVRPFSVTEYYFFEELDKRHIKEIVFYAKLDNLDVEKIALEDMLKNPLTYNKYDFISGATFKKFDFERVSHNLMIQELQNRQKTGEKMKVPFSLNSFLCDILTTCMFLPKD